MAEDPIVIDDEPGREDEISFDEFKKAAALKGTDVSFEEYQRLNRLRRERPGHSFEQLLQIEDDDGNETDETTEDEESEDEFKHETCIHEYDVFYKKPTKMIYVLQFVGRAKGSGPMDGGKPMIKGHAPLGIRMKQDSGYVEVDVPIDIHSDGYDRMKGVRFGEALKKVKAYGQKSYGVAEGFTRVFPKSAKKPRRAKAADDEEEDDDDEEELPEEEIPYDDDDPAAAARRPKLNTGLDDDTLEQYVSNFEDANNKGHVMNHITWGGKVLARDAWKPQYMLGRFRNNELHLTPIEGIVKLYPEYHQIDAISHVEKALGKKDKAEAKDVMPAVKKSAEEMTNVDLLKGNTDEPWVPFKFNDVNSEPAWETQQMCFVQDTENALSLEFEPVKDYVNRILPKVVTGKEGEIPEKKQKKFKPIVK